MRKECSCMLLQEVFDLKAKTLLSLRMIVSLDPDGKLRGLQVTIRWSSGLQRWTTVLKVASSTPSRG